MEMQNPTIEKKLAAYRLVIHEVINNFNGRSKRCMYRFKNCACINANNETHSCLWSSCPLGE